MSIDGISYRRIWLQLTTATEQFVGLSSIAIRYVPLSIRVAATANSHPVELPVAVWDH